MKKTILTLAALAIFAHFAMAQKTEIMENSKNCETAGREISAAGTEIEHALTLRERHFADVAARAAVGDLKNLEIAFERALDDRVAINELKEICVQLYAYCGFPRSLNALGTLMKTVRSREIAGKNDVLGNEPTPRAADVSSLEIGTANQTKLCGAPVKGELYDFAPAIDEFLKSHLFGDIFSRDNLTWREREIATIAALAAMSGVEPQRDAHIRIGQHNGVTDAQVAEILEIAAGTEF